MWKCKNEKCTEFNKGVELLKMDAFIAGGIYLTKEERKVETTCKTCNERLSFEMPDKYKTSDFPSIAKFAGLSNEDKKKMIKKRYETAQKKEGGKEMINEIRKERIKKMTGE
jgi:hypothetical protein